MKVLTVVGARPQFIKAGPVSRELRRHGTEILLHTGQHYDHAMSEAFFEELRIPTPDYNLGVGSGPHGKQTGQMLSGIEAVMLDERPDWLLVYGDTNSTVAGALAAAKLHIPIAHVEAGLRSYDRRMPEEVNRVITDHLSDLCLCPTETARTNLSKEGITTGVHVVGDVMYDAHLEHLAAARAKRANQAATAPSSPYDLLTLHRAENVDDDSRLLSILQTIEAAGRPTVFPAHPRTRVALERVGWSPPGQMRLIEPVGYLELTALADAAELILTDSGGVQKEAYFLGRPCITLRDTTEWTETVAAGWNVLVGAGSTPILQALQTFRPAGPRPDLFGDGNAANRIVRLLERAGHAGSATATMRGSLGL